MKILDTNMILRFLLRDNEEMANKAAEIIKSEGTVFTNEVAAEVVYVLTGVYKLERAAVSKALLAFIEIDGVKSTEYGVLSKALIFYAENSLDFVDNLLCAYNLQYGYEVCTFDRKLGKFLEKLHSAPDESDEEAED